MNSQLSQALESFRLWRDIGNDILIAFLIIEIFVEVWPESADFWSPWPPGRVPWRIRRRLINFRIAAHLSKRALLFCATIGIVVGVGTERIFGNRADDKADEIRASLEYAIVDGSQRTLTDRFAKCLSGKPTGEVRILYKHEDSEAYWFAKEIAGELRDFGWTVTDPASIPPSGGDPLLFGRDIPSDIRYGVAGGSGLSLWSDRSCFPSKHNDACSSLSCALGFGVQKKATALFGFTDPSLPENHFIVVVGQNLRIILPE